MYIFSALFFIVLVPKNLVGSFKNKNINNYLKCTLRSHLSLKTPCKESNLIGEEIQT